MSSHGSKLALPLFFVLVLSLSSAVATYRLRKSAEIKRWEKTMELYSSRLREENQAAIKGIIAKSEEDK